MSYSVTKTESTTFTVTHARHLAAKVATDLKRMQRMYGFPSDQAIANFETEVIELLRGDYLESVCYGFRRDRKWIEPALRYTSSQLATNGLDDDPGRIPLGKDTEGASFYSFLTYSAVWHQLTPAERQAIKARLPIQRGDADEPQVEGGYFANDKTYSAGGQSLGRQTVRKF